MDPGRPVPLAAITGAHGVRGEVRLKLLGADGLESLKPHRSFNGSAVRIASIRSDGKGGAIARLEGVADRTAAERLRGTELAVPRSALPEPEDGEFYHADLLGLPVEDEDGAPVGTVAATPNYGATDLVEIERPGGGRFLVPFTKDAVTNWNTERMVIASAFVE